MTFAGMAADLPTTISLDDIVSTLGDEDGLEARGESEGDELQELLDDKVAAEEEHEEWRLVHGGGVVSFSAGCGLGGENAVIGLGYHRPAGVYGDKRSDSPGKLSRL